MKKVIPKLLISVTDVGDPGGACLAGEKIISSFLNMLDLKCL